MRLKDKNVDDLFKELAFYLYPPSAWEVMKNIEYQVEVISRILR